MILWVLGISFLFRLFIAQYGTLQLDMNAFIYWSNRLIQVNWTSFYEVWCDYLPTYLYILAGLGYLKNFFVSVGINLPEFVIYKLPSIFADIGMGWMIHKIFKQNNKKKLGIIAALVYLLNPAIFGNSTLWGQADSLFAFATLLSFYLYYKKNYLSASMLLAATSLLKPLGFLLVPVFVFDLWKKEKIKEIIYSGTVFILFSFLLFLPFSSGNMLNFIISRFSQTFNQYPYTTLNAFNFWQFLDMNWVKDSLKFIAMSYQNWGIILFAPFYFTFLKQFSQQKSIFKKSLIIGLVFYFNFLFTTRMHERHLFTALPFLLLGMGEDKTIGFFYVLASLTYSLNLYYAWRSIEKRNFVLSSFLIKTLSLTNILNAMALFLKNSFAFIKNNCENLCSKISILVQRIGLKSKQKKLNYENIFLLIFVLFILFTRFYQLGYPQDYIYDEVYHAFTAGEMAEGNVKAWEWWNNAPEGFAYEWTHPHLAKILMSLGIKVFGNNSFGWRFGSAVFGTGVILLTYLLGKEIFKNKKIAVVAAVLFSLDGMLLTMSRIGMTDVYLVFFILLTILLSLKKRIFLASVSLGMTIGAKWTGIYLIPIIGLILIWKQEKHDIFSKSLLKNILTFVFITPLVYTATYLPFFLTEHTLTQFFELQKSMWGYHTKLKATHGFQSEAYTWPFMIRPVWFWVDYQKNKIANIYNLGNPLLWWSSLTILPIYIYRSIEKYMEKKKKNMLILIPAYFVFWVPWIFSPRVMFLHHYLPALPFLFLMNAWFWVKEIKELVTENKTYYLITLTYLAIIFITFLYFLPIYIGIPLPKNRLDWWFWFSTWK